jgi:hypothetical protein
MGIQVVFENERVRVLRARHAPREKHPSASRRDRLIIYLNDGHIRRRETGGDRPEEIQRKSGDVVWKEHSQHEIENVKDSDHEVVIVELK